MKKRNILLILLILLGVITFLDRVNIGVASTKMMEDLNIDKSLWGWVHGAFVLSYGLFQIPFGVLGDRKGQRIVLAVIVLWWSLFTGLTGLVSGVVSLIIIRFAFGIGEAGAYPCMTSALGRWFPKSRIGTAQGFIWAASRIGGALTPFIVYPVINNENIGWRGAFYLLGGIGIVWVVIWYFWYRDNPSDMKGMTSLELNEISGNSFTKKSEKVPWSLFLRNGQFWRIIFMYWFYGWATWFFFSWFPNFMEKGRGFDKSVLMYAISVPFVMSMIGNISGGFLSDWLSKKFGLKKGRTLLGTGSLLASALCMFLAAFIPGKIEVFIFLSLCFGVIDIMLPSAWAICMDVGGKYAGSVSGAMNTAGNVGGFLSASLFGYLVDMTGNYNFPLYLISGMLVVSALLFAGIDASKSLVAEKE